MDKDFVAISTIDDVDALLGIAPIGTVIVNREGEILYANATITTMLGYDTEASLVRQPLSVLVPLALEQPHQEFMAGFFENPRRRPMGLGKSLYARHRNGAPVPVEIGLVPARLAGQPVVIAYVSNLSAFQRAQHRFQHLFSSLPLGLLVVNDNRLITQVNPALCQLFGYTSEALIGQHVHMLLPLRLHGIHTLHMRDYLRTPSDRQMGSGRDLTGLHSTGKEFAVEVALSRFESQNDTSTLAIISDISSRVRSEAALRQTLAQLEEFTYVAAHDLRAPLRGIADLLTWIREDLDESTLTDDIRNNFVRATVRVEKAERLIEDLLDYARAGDQFKKFEYCDPHEAIKDAILEANVPPGFTVDIDVEGLPFRTSKVALSLVLRNLISNAVKHHGATEGRICIKLREEGRFSIFSIEDDGQGITPGTEERIFKLFRRGNVRSEGHGVGLAVTRRTVNAMGGMISVNKGAQLGGACFVVYWPRILMLGENHE